MTALHIAIESKGVEVAKLLIEHAAAIDMKDEVFAPSTSTWKIYQFAIFRMAKPLST